MAVFKKLLVGLLLTAFLIVQADLPVARVAAVAGEKCMPSACCCAPEARQGSTCCCAPQKPNDSGHALRAANCADDQSPGDSSIVVKFQIVLPLSVAFAARDAEAAAIIVRPVSPTLHDGEPPVPPPRLLVG